MPAISFEKVVDCSSEDEEFSAKNLLNKDLIKSWKTANVGETQAFVILQLSSLSKINSLEIGGEASAFIEVLVRRSNSESSQFEVLLSPSSFMTPSESKSLTNINRVRLFDKSKLCPNTVEDSWDQIKVVCTQPFNKSVKYGIAFVRVISPSKENEDIEETSLSSLKLGAFKVKQSTSSQAESSAVGSWFAKRDKTPTSIDEDNDSNKMALRRKETKKPSLAAAAGITPKRQRRETPKTTENSEKKVSVSNDANLSSRKIATVSSKTVPFHKVMSKVIFAISGIQNPERAELRAKALEMGAKYKADWDNTCTHLICAFVNTPKYSQVIAVKGRIITKSWINDCYTQRKLLPWRDYKLGQYSDNSSPDEDEEEPAPTNSSYYIETDDEEAQQIEATPLNTSVKKVVCERVATVNTNSGNNVNDDSVYDLETEPESDDQQQPSTTPEKPSQFFFKSKHFNLYGNFDDSERTKLKHYIITFGGKMEETINEKVNYVISHSSWNEDFENALTVNEHILFVRPKWIFSCNERNKLVPFQCYIIPANFD